MLKRRFHSLFSNHLSAATKSFHRLFLNPFASFLTILVIAIALMLPSIFWVINTNIERFIKTWRQTAHISLYLSQPCSREKSLSILKDVQNQSDTGSAFLTTPEEGLEELKQQAEFKDINAYFSLNPLPPVITVIPAETIREPEQIKDFYQHLKSIPGVERAEVDIEWITRLYGLLNFTTKTARTLLLFFTIAVVFIIATTLRLSMHKDLEEIRVLKLIGATDTWIIRPFLYSGLWYGLGGAIFAIILVNFFVLYIGLPVTRFTEMQDYFRGLSVKQAYLILIFSVLLGGFAARVAVKKQVTFIEPYT